MPQTSIIIPVLNEAENIPVILKRIRDLSLVDYEIIFVDDGSTDDSFLQIELQGQELDFIKCISFSRNFGHQNALMAGMTEAKGENIIIMDADLQHPPELLPEMLLKLREGFDVINTRRSKTENIPVLKKILSNFFYFIINLISDTKIENGVADFKAFNKKVLHSILKFNERDLFLRGIFSWVGYRQITIDFIAPKRKNGKTKYSLHKMFSLGLKGTLAFSFKPLRIAIIVGTFISIGAFCFAIFALVAYFKGETVTGWASTIIASMLVGGTQLLAIGLLGEYISGLFTEAKKRPLYLINKTINIS